MIEPEWNTWAREGLERGPDCPDDETLRRWLEENADGSPHPHVARCSRCRLQVEEMAAFLADPPEQAREIEESLRALLSDAPPAEAARPSAVEAVSPGRTHWLAWFAAAAAIVLALSLLLRREPAPEIPTLPEEAGAVRGAAIRLLTPPGPGIPPERLTWRSEVEGPWVVRLERVDGELLWSATASTAEVPLPPAVRDRLQPGSRYLWSVTAPGGATASGTLQVAAEGGEGRGAGSEPG